MELAVAKIFGKGGSANFKGDCMRTKKPKGVSFILPQKEKGRGPALLFQKPF